MSDNTSTSETNKIISQSLEKYTLRSMLDKIFKDAAAVAEFIASIDASVNEVTGVVYRYYIVFHDPHVAGQVTGDVDDLAAMRLYETMMKIDPYLRVTVYLTDERLVAAQPYFTDTNLVIKNLSEKGPDGKVVINLKEADLYSADKIGVFAPIADKDIRDMITRVILAKKNGYCQGDKIGVTNFPNKDYENLLHAIDAKFSTETTNLSFPSELLTDLDPNFSEKYLSYGLLKLIAIGGIARNPKLVYRLYCPGIGGGPGTNLIKILELIQKNNPFQSVPSDVDFTSIPCDMASAGTLCQHIIDLYDKKQKMENTADPLDGFMPLDNLIDEASKDATIDTQSLRNSLKVMLIFGNMIYAPTDGTVLFNNTQEKFHSFLDIPSGKLMISLDKTPPLYDLVAAYCMMFDSPDEFSTVPSNFVPSNIQDLIMGFFKKE